MKFKLQSRSEQVANAIRAEIMTGKWGGELPGVLLLEKEFGINRSMLTRAIQQLEEEKLLVSQGAGKPRRIEIPKQENPGTLRIGILLYDAEDLHQVHPLSEVKYQLEQAGHSVVIGRSSLVGMGMCERRVARSISQYDVDAWVVCSASRPLLKWFARHPLPSFAFLGDFSGLDIAAVRPDQNPVYANIVRKLMKLGHKRIVFITRSTMPTTVDDELASVPEERGVLARVFAERGLTYSHYNRPYIGGTPDQLHDCLDRMFQLTPPTAFYVDEAFLALVVYQHLARRGLRIPEDVSLVCNDDDLAFLWNRRVISHMQWDTHALVRRVLDWVTHVATGVDDRSQIHTPVEFIEGETMAAPPANRARLG